MLLSSACRLKGVCCCLYNNPSERERERETRGIKWKLLDSIDRYCSIHVATCEMHLEPIKCGRNAMAVSVTRSRSVSIPGMRRRRRWMRPCRRPAVWCCRTAIGRRKRTGVTWCLRRIRAGMTCTWWRKRTRRTIPATTASWERFSRDSSSSSASSAISLSSSSSSALAPCTRPPTVNDRNSESF